MEFQDLKKAWVVPYSIWLTIANISRVLSGKASGRSFAAGVVGLRVLYLPPVVPQLSMEEMSSFLDKSNAATTIVIPSFNKGEFDKVGGGTGADRLVKVASLIRLHACKTAFEIGTFVGGGSVWIASNLEKDGHLHTLDLPLDATNENVSFSYRSDRRVAQYQGRRQRIFHALPIQEMITEHFGDSTLFDFSSLGIRFDFFYIDGDHRLAAVAKDTLSALSVLSDDGFIIWDDYLPYHMVSHPDVVQFVNWFHKVVDPVFDIGGQAAWFAKKSCLLPRVVKDKCEIAIRLKWPRLL